MVLHLLGGPGPPRRIKFDGQTLKGLHADERSIAGTIGKVIATPLPPIGHWQPITAGISHSGGGWDSTLQEWREETTILLDADAPRLWAAGARLPEQGEASDIPINFLLSDDQPLGHVDAERVISRSLGETWLQGHMAIGLVHFLLDEGIELNL